MQKTDWSTNSAVSEISKRLHIGKERLSFAGMKDKTATTTQLASAEGIKKEQVLALHIKDIKIKGAWISDDKVRLGSLLGNRFRIRLRDCSTSEKKDQDHKTQVNKKVNKIFKELGKKFPNYFGEQRFGSIRAHTHEIGQLILKGDFENAVTRFLCDSDGETHEEAVLARKQLKENNDYRAALKYFPKHLRLEYSMLSHLSRRPGDYKGAIMSLPRNVSLLFIHAFQSHMFNILLSERITEAKDSGNQLELEEGEYFCGETFGFPDTTKTEAEGWICAKIIGHGSPLNVREKKLFETFGITKDSFKMKDLPALASKGSHRTLLAPLKDFVFDEADEENENGEPVFSF